MKLKNTQDYKWFIWNKITNSKVLSSECQAHNTYNWNDKKWSRVEK